MDVVASWNEADHLGSSSLRVSRSLRIPPDEIDWRATTTGGPGGQHANRTRSGVDVSFRVQDSKTLGPRQRTRLLERYGPVVRASASEHRSQAQNRRLALERLAQRIGEGLKSPRLRRATLATRASVERRLSDKRSRAQLKASRARPGPDE
ncbi:MAG: alternative ribosome rescue aminoacyl-tRNA hydrolase ArfB [Acidimicrobiales bacterium]